MPRYPASSSVTLDRRAAVLGTGALAAALGMSRLTNHATAQDTARIDYSDHPLTGTWLGLANPTLPENPKTPGPALFGADGTVFLLFPATDAGPDGPFAQTPYIGVWEPYDEQIGHFTATQLLSGLDGTYLGSVTVDGHPKVSEDGQTFIDDGSLNTVTIRDATGAVTLVVPPGTPGPPVTGTRMGVGVSGFPDEEPAAGTPTG